MRSLSRMKQNIWHARMEETQDGIDTVLSYSKPEKLKLPVSATAGTPEEMSAGIVPTYDRYITSYDRSLDFKETDVFLIDVVPEVDDNGNLVMQEDGVTPVTPPDYTLKKLLVTQKGKVFRFGISKIGGSE